MHKYLVSIALANSKFKDYLRGFEKTSVRIKKVSAILIINIKDHLISMDAEEVCKKGLGIISMVI